MTSDEDVVTALHDAARQLVGRPRLSARFIELLAAQCALHTASETSVALVDLIKAAYLDTRLHYCGLGASEGLKGPDTLHSHVMEAIADLPGFSTVDGVAESTYAKLDDVLTAAVLSGSVQFHESTTDSPFGLAHADALYAFAAARREAFDSHHGMVVTINEPLIVELLLEIFGPFVPRAVKLMKAVRDTLGRTSAAKGNCFEHAVAAGLISRSATHELANVATWCESMIGTAEGLPDWLAEASLNFNKLLSQESTDQIVDILEEVCTTDSSATGRVPIWSPESVVGPDLLGRLSAHVAIACGCKFYGCAIDDSTKVHNERTTDLMKLYSQKDGMPNGSCSKIRGKALHVAEGIKHTLRFVFFVDQKQKPSTISSCSCKVDGNDFIIYVNRHNMKLFFQGVAWAEDAVRVDEEEEDVHRAKRMRSSDGGAGSA